MCIFSVIKAYIVITDTKYAKKQLGQNQNVLVKHNLQILTVLRIVYLPDKAEARFLRRSQGRCTKLKFYRFTTCK